MCPDSRCRASLSQPALVRRRRDVPCVGLHQAHSLDRHASCSSALVRRRQPSATRAVHRERHLVRTGPRFVMHQLPPSTLGPLVAPLVVSAQGFANKRSALLLGVAPLFCRILRAIRTLDRLTPVGRAESAGGGSEPCMSPLHSPSAVRRATTCTSDVHRQCYSIPESGHQLGADEGNARRTCSTYRPCHV